MLSQEHLTMLRTKIPADFVRGELPSAALGEQILGPTPEGAALLDRLLILTEQIIEEREAEHDRNHANGAAAGLLDCLFFHQDMAEGRRHAEYVRAILAVELRESFSVEGELALRKEGVVLLPKAQGPAPADAAVTVEKS